MFRSIRKKRNELSLAATKELLRSVGRGVLAMHGDDGYPYAIPINYLYDEASEQIIFHGTKFGHKVDALNACDKVCFTVVGNEQVKQEPWAPFVQSAVVFGRCRLLEPSQESMQLLKRMAMKYYPNEALADESIAFSCPSVQMYVIDIEHLSGKEVQEK